MGDLQGLLKAGGKEIEASPVSGEKLGELVGMVAKGRADGQAGQGRIAEDVRDGRPAPGRSWSAKG